MQMDGKSLGIEGALWDQEGVKGGGGGKDGSRDCVGGRL